MDIRNLPAGDDRRGGFAVKPKSIHFKSANRTVRIAHRSFEISRSLNPHRVLFPPPSCHPIPMTSRTIPPAALIQAG